MYNVIQLLAKYGGHILFIVLEIICFSLIINYNKTQRDIYFNSSNVYAAKISEQQAKIGNYLHLQNQNDSLLLENATLKENLILIDYSSDNIPNPDSIYNQYSLIPAYVRNTTFHLRNNHITIDKGSREGVKPDMGVISASQGVIGIVRNVSENFAHIISILNTQTKISCTIKNKKGLGSLVWKDLDHQRMTLESVPKHEVINVGDTIITSGFSRIFPRGILVGKIEKYKINPGSNSYEITVKLFNDLTNIKYAYVVQNRFGEEQNKLENEVSNE